MTPDYQVKVPAIRAKQAYMSRLMLGRWLMFGSIRVQVAGGMSWLRGRAARLTGNARFRARDALPGDIWLNDIGPVGAERVRMGNSGTQVTHVARAE
jgi:hypothetical protein